jgi:hypothetical protein
MRRSWTVIAVLAAICCAVLGVSAAYAKDAPAEAEPAAAATPLDESCATGNVCYWSSTGYSGSKSYVTCDTGTFNTSFSGEGAKNRCPNKSATLRRNGTFEECVPANENWENAEYFNEIQIGKEGSGCP